MSVYTEQNRVFITKQKTYNKIFTVFFSFSYSYFSQLFMLFKDGKSIRVNDISNCLYRRIKLFSKLFSKLFTYSCFLRSGSSETLYEYPTGKGQYILGLYATRCHVCILNSIPVGRSSYRILELSMYVNLYITLNSLQCQIFGLCMES